MCMYVLCVYYESFTGLIPHNTIKRAIKHEQKNSEIERFNTKKEAT